MIFHHIGEFIKWVCPQNSQVMDDKYWYLQMGLPSGFFPSPYLARGSATWSPRHLQLCLVSAPERSRRSGGQSIGCCFLYQCSIIGLKMIPLISTCSSCLLLVNKKPWIFYLISPNKWRSPVEFPLGLETSQEDRQFKSCRIPPNTATNNLFNFFWVIYVYIYIYRLPSTLLHHPNPIWKLNCLHMSNVIQLYNYIYTYNTL